MEDAATAARSQALSLLKKKLGRSGKAQRRIAVDNEQRAGPEPVVQDSKLPIFPEEPDGISDNNQEEEKEIHVEATQRDQQRHIKRISPETNEIATPSAPLVAHDSHQATQRRPLKKLVVKWSCTRCQRECIPIREESRCLCGHRYKEHPSTKEDPRVAKNKALASRTFEPFMCTAAKCSCRAFFYVVAEGAWILRCRCKHKHTDHDASGQPFACRNAKCACEGFDSPWVCNCDHPWSDHVQETIEKEFKPLELFQDQFTVDDLSNVQRTDLRHEPLRLRG